MQTIQRELHTWAGTILNFPFRSFKGQLGHWRTSHGGCVPDLPFVVNLQCLLQRKAAFSTERSLRLLAVLGLRTPGINASTTTSIVCHVRPKRC